MDRCIEADVLRNLGYYKRRSPPRRTGFSSRKAHTQPKWLTECDFGRKRVGLITVPASITGKLLPPSSQRCNERSGCRNQKTGTKNSGQRCAHCDPDRETGQPPGR